MQQVGLHPRAYYFHNFLTKAERGHLVKLAAPKLKRSTVVGNDGEGVVDNIRTSYGMFIRRLQDPVVARIEKRISLWTHLPVEHQEDIQVQNARVEGGVKSTEYVWRRMPRDFSHDPYGQPG